MAHRLSFWKRQRDEKGRKVDPDIFSNAEAELEPELLEVVYAMRIAKIYNHHTGANITHFDVQNWGWRDQTLILNATIFLSKT